MQCKRSSPGCLKAAERDAAAVRCSRNLGIGQRQLRGGSALCKLGRLKQPGEVLRCGAARRSGRSLRLRGFAAGELTQCGTLLPFATGAARSTQRVRFAQQRLWHGPAFVQGLHDLLP